MSTCKLEGCGKPHQGLGYCDAHYRRFKKYGDPLGAKPAFVPSECSVAGCAKKAECKGMCKAHYYRMLRNGDPSGGRASKGEPLEWLTRHKDHKSEECLIWPFRKRTNGYGEVPFEGIRMAASRAMCTLAHGPAPTAEHHAAHSCGNGGGGCVNPQHLRWATREENEGDKIGHGRTNRGSRHGMSKLSTDEVLQIRALKGTEAQKETADRFGISRSAVGSIQSGARWSWLD